MNRSSVANPRRVRRRGPDGRSRSLASLPLVAFALNCGHLGREYAVTRGDHVFCEQCATTKRVARIIAA